MDELEFKIFMIKLQLNLFIIAMRELLTCAPLCPLLPFMPVTSFFVIFCFFIPKKEKGQFHLYHFSRLFAKVVSEWLVVKIDSTATPILSSAWQLVLGLQVQVVNFDAFCIWLQISWEIGLIRFCTHLSIQVHLIQVGLFLQGKQLLDDQIC